LGKHPQSGDQKDGKVPVKKISISQKRLEILKNWYLALCSKHKNDRELIVREIDGLTKKDIVKELIEFCPCETDKRILKNTQILILIGQQGDNVWGFEKTKGNKSQKKFN
jgi:hypothetical protein